MTYENYREPGEFGEGATVCRAEHVGKYKSHGPLIDGWSCSCGWESAPFYDGSDLAEAAWREHVKEQLDPVSTADSLREIASVRTGILYSKRKVLNAAADRIDALEATLRKIAAYDDAAANAYLRATGSYSAFDEPGAVEMARVVLEGRNDG